MPGVLSWAGQHRTPAAKTWREDMARRHGAKGMAQGPQMSPQIKVIDHPLVLHKLSLIRRKQTSTNEFRQLVKEISPLLLFEATRDLPMTFREIETPLE